MFKTTYNYDGWSNVFTKLGTNKDPQTAARVASKARLNQAALENIYRCDGLGRRIIALPAKEMTREGFFIEGDTDNLIPTEFKTKGFDRKIRETLELARLYGGAIAIMGIKDGGDLETPVNEANIDSVEFLRVYDRYQLDVNTDDLFDDPNEDKFGEPEFYNVTPLSTRAITTGGISSRFKVHESRLLRFDGAFLPERLYVQNNYWFDSELEAVFSDLQRCGEAYGYASTILRTFAQTVLQVNNLASLLQGEGGAKLIRDRLDIMDMSRSLLNTILIDDGESFEFKSTSVTGIDSLMDKICEKVSSTSGIPTSLLFEKQVAGLGDKGKSDIDNFYDDIAGQQESKLAPPLKKLLRYMLLSKKLNNSGIDPESFTLEFHPLKQMSEKEKADIRKIMSEADSNYINVGVLTPDTVALSRFGGDSYTIEVDLSQGITKDLVKSASLDTFTNMSNEEDNIAEGAESGSSSESE